MFRHLELACSLPLGAIEQRDGVGDWRDVAGDLAQLGLHGVGVGSGQDERGASSPCRADVAEEIEALIPLILGLAGAVAFVRSLADQAVLTWSATFRTRRPSCALPSAPMNRFVSQPQEVADTSLLRASAIRFGCSIPPCLVSHQRRTACAIGSIPFSVHHGFSLPTLWSAL